MKINFGNEHQPVGLLEIFVVDSTVPMGRGVLIYVIQAVNDLPKFICHDVAKMRVVNDLPAFKCSD